MENVISQDGTKIAYERTGAGPALLIIGGAMSDHHNYSTLAAELAHTFSVYNYDRRGRGESGNTLPYSVEREVEDVRAMLDRMGESAMIYGHSAGAALALRVAAGGGNIDKLVISDPPFTPSSDNDSQARDDYAQEAATIQALYDQGDHKGAAAFFLGGFGLSAEEVEGILDSPAGAGMIACASTLPYDYAVLGDGLIPDDIAVHVAVPTLILASEALHETAVALADLIPIARLHPLHCAAHESCPTSIAEAIRSFYLDT